MRTFNHVGIVTTEHKEGAFFNERAQRMADRL